jgi:hypothetical protein
MFSWRDNAQFRDDAPCTLPDTDPVKKALNEVKAARRKRRIGDMQDRLASAAGASTTVITDFTTAADGANTPPVHGESKRSKRVLIPRFLSGPGYAAWIVALSEKAKAEEKEKADEKAQKEKEKADKISRANLEKNLRKEARVNAATAKAAAKAKPAKRGRRADNAVGGPPAQRTKVGRAAFGGGCLFPCLKKNKSNGPKHIPFARPYPGARGWWGRGT